MQALLLSISINSSAVLVARTTANQIVVEISRKQYSVTEVRVQTVADDVLEALARANRFLGLARDNSQHSQEVASSLMAVGARLREAGSLATDTVGVANRAQEEVLQIEEVGQEVEVRGNSCSSSLHCAPAPSCTLHPVLCTLYSAGSVERSPAAAGEWEQHARGGGGCRGNWGAAASRGQAGLPGKAKLPQHICSCCTANEMCGM